MELQLLRDATLLVGVDHLRWDYAASPYLVLLRDEKRESPWPSHAVSREQAAQVSRRIYSGL
jgi:hypothetical protein